MVILPPGTIERILEWIHNWTYFAWRLLFVPPTQRRKMDALAKMVQAGICDFSNDSPKEVNLILSERRVSFIGTIDDNDANTEG